MTRDEMVKKMQAIFRECEELHIAAQREYTLTADAFGNFSRLSNELGFPPELVLWIYARKHVDGITSYIMGHRSQREGVAGRINDLIVYLCILRGILEGPVREEAEE